MNKSKNEGKKRRSHFGIIILVFKMKLKGIGIHFKLLDSKVCFEKWGAIHEAFETKSLKEYLFTIADKGICLINTYIYQREKNAYNVN